MAETFNSIFDSAAVLFDLDGVLTPTAELHRQAWGELFRPVCLARGVPAYTDEDYFRFIDGKPRLDGVRAFLAGRGIVATEEDVAALGEQKNALFSTVLERDGVLAYSGVIKLLAELATANIPVAVVTSSRNAATVLKAAGLEKHFNLVVDGQVAATEGLAGKPDPATFLFAARCLEVDPARTVVLEDALSGVAAARAGSFGLIIGVNRGVGAFELLESGADVVVEEVDELLPRFETSFQSEMKDFGDDPWLLREDHYGATQVPVRETLFTVGNGFVGVRGTLDEGVAESGTFINGLHATFPIKYPEDAYGFAHAGQTIVAAPDASQLRVEVSGSALELSEPSVKSYERVLDMRTGLLRRTVEWDSPQGRLLIQTERMVSLARPDLALFEVTVTALEQDVEIVVVSRLARQSDTYIQEELDPRHAECIPGLFTWEAGFVAGTSGSAVGRCVGSGLVASVAVAHVIEGASLQVSNKGSANDVADVVAAVGEDEVTHRITLQIPAHHRVRVIKVVGFSVNVESSDTAVMAAQAAVERGLTCGASGLRAEQQAWLNEFWARSDIAIGGASGAVQQAVHWTLFQLAQASAQVAGHGIAAKGVSGSGYSGHYFWDTEIFVLPFLTYTAPQRARAVLEFRHSLLPAAKHRAAELGHAGALFAWRTINGEEASAYFPAGTAQYHINADVAYSVRQYIAATNDADFLAKSGRELLAQTARFWVDLGFYGADGLFHLHEVTGPDEYSALVDDNVFTNVMARANLNMAADVVGGLEADEWRRAAAAMAVPFDNKKGIHPQDMQFLERAVWDFAGTPKEKYPLLLHFHPLTIYRHQVLKQADLVLALWLLGSEFTMAEKVADFSYYDQLTTGDSTLSAAAQQIVAAEVGKTELAWRYFLQGLSVDLKNAHGNTADGVHVAAAGGVWSMLVCGFGGFRDDGGFRLDPRLPAQWESLIFRLTLPGRRVRAEIRHTTVRLVVEEAVNDLPPLQISVAESVVLLGGLGCDVVVALPEL